MCEKCRSGGYTYDPLAFLSELLAVRAMPGPKADMEDVYSSVSLAEQAKRLRGSVLALADHLDDLRGVVKDIKAHQGRHCAQAQAQDEELNDLEDYRKDTDAILARHEERLGSQGGSLSRFLERIEDLEVGRLADRERVDSLEESLRAQGRQLEELQLRLNGLEPQEPESPFEGEAVDPKAEILKANPEMSAEDADRLLGRSLPETGGRSIGDFLADGGGRGPFEVDRPSASEIEASWLEAEK